MFGAGCRRTFVVVVVWLWLSGFLRKAAVESGSLEYIGSTYSSGGVVTMCREAVAPGAVCGVEVSVKLAVN